MMQPEKGDREEAHNGTHHTEEDSPFGEVVFRYTRAQAIADGVLIDVTDTAKELGFRLPVALTAGVWAECVEVPAEATGQDEQGRLWDVLGLLRFAIQGRRGRPDNRVDFVVQVERADRSTEEVDLYALCGPGDEAEPVITVMLPHED